MMLNTFKLGAKYPVHTGRIKAKFDAASEGKKVLIPAYATTAELIPEKKGFQRYFKDGDWHYVIDNIGTDYWNENGTKHTITELGEEFPEGALLEEPPKPEPTFEEMLAATIAQREAAYKSESDPLYMEWQYDQTDSAEKKWRDKVAEIKARLPLPTE
jgi:hypothetical protein